MTEIYEHFDPLIGESVSTVSALPVGNNWVGRHIYVEAEDGDFRWDGSAWKRADIQSEATAYNTTTVLDVTPIMRGGVAAGTTSGTGVLSHTFPTPFPNGLIGVLLMPHQESNVGSYPLLVRATTTRTGFQTLWGGKASAAVSVPYIAFGW